MLKKITLLREQIPSFDRYPFSIPAIKTLDEMHFDRPVTFFVGENGSGKSTLLEAIADKCEFNIAGGSRHNLYDVHASDAALGNYIRLSWMPKLTDGFFLRRNRFIILPRIWMKWIRRGMRITEGGRCMSNRTGSRLCRFF